MPDLIEEGLGSVMGDRNAGYVDQFKRPHSDAQSIHDRFIDGGYVGPALFQDAGGFVV